MIAISDVVSVLAATIRIAVPLTLAAIAGLYSERAGVVDVGLEGKMLVGAFAAAATGAATGNVWLGLLAAIAAAMAFGLVHGFACISQRGNQVVSGMAINVLVSGLTITLGIAWFHQGGQTPPLAATARLTAITLPGTAALSGIPIAGPIWQRLIGGQNPITYATFLLVPATAFILARTRFGLRLRAAGENPAAVDTAGISVTRLRYAGVLIASALCGMAGTTIAMAEGAGFIRDMTAGRGYIALAALVLGKWRPWPTLATCLLFGLLDALAIRLQGVAIPGIGAFPEALVSTVPYLITVILLAGFVGRAIPPAAGGHPYVKER